MRDLVRDSVVGQIVNAVSNGRLLPYADQRSTYVVPERYRLHSTSLSRAATIDGKYIPAQAQENSEEEVSRPSTLPGSAPTATNASVQTLNPALGTTMASEGTKEPVGKEKDLEEGDNLSEKLREGLAMAKLPPELHSKDVCLVDWDGPEDPDNPRNWSFFKRCFVGFEVCLLTFAIYIGSAIYISSIPSLQDDFNISRTKASLGLTLYVMAYGIGPMFLTPLQEIPLFGRNPVYILSLLVFVLFNVPIVTAGNFSTILAFRFLTGFMASPSLATGPASMSDIFPPHWLPHAVGVWSISAVLGPIAGPVIGGFAAQANGWRWPIYELIWISGFTLAFLSFLFPETLAANILLKRARRLRKLTGNPNLRSQSEIDQALLSGRQVAFESLVRPFLLASEPAVMFSNIYLGLVYSVFYLWFEAFPIVFNEIYHMNLGVGSLPYLGFVVTTSVTFTFYCVYLSHPRFKDPNLPPEARLQLGLCASISIPISLFMFGWTSRKSVNWIAPTIGAALYMPGLYFTFQSILIYLSMSYPKYTGSALAGNDFFRSVMASVFPIFGNAFFRNLGVGAGSSLLAGISLGLIPVFYLLTKYGDKLRARSRYAGFN